MRIHSHIRQAKAKAIAFAVFGINRLSYCMSRARSEPAVWNRPMTGATHRNRKDQKLLLTRRKKELPIRWHLGFL